MIARKQTSSEPTLAIVSEFGEVIVRADHAGNGDRLMVRSLKTGLAIYLDGMELESMTKLRHADLAGLVAGAGYVETDEASTG